METIGIWTVSKFTQHKPYGSLTDTDKFENLIRRLKGSQWVANSGKTGTNEFYDGMTYHVEPEGVTVTYNYLSRERAEVLFRGSKGHRESVQERLLKLL